MVRALIKENTSFLTTNDIGHIRGAVHMDRNSSSRSSTNHHIRAFFQAFKSPGAACTVHDNSRHTCDLNQRANKRLDHNIRICRVRLHDSRIAKAINDNARQTVSLSVYQAVKRCIKHPLTVIQCAAQSSRKPRLINHRINVTIQHPAKNLGCGVDRNHAQWTPFGVFKQRNCARLDAFGAAVHDHLVCVNPWKTMANGARIALWVEAHSGECCISHTCLYSEIGRLGKRPAALRQNSLLLALTTSAKRP